MKDILFNNIAFERTIEEWSDRKYMNFRVSDIGSEIQRTNLNTAINKFCESIKHFRFERTARNIFNNLFSSLQKMVSLQEFEYIIWGPIQVEEIDMPRREDIMPFSSTLKSIRLIINEYDNFTLDFLKFLTDLAPNLENFGIGVYLYDADYTFLQVIQACGHRLKQFTLFYQTEDYTSNEILILLASVDFPMLEELELYVRFREIKNKSGEICGIMKQFKERNQLIKLKIEIAGEIVIDDSIMASLNCLENLAVQSKIFSFKKRGNYAISNLKVVNLIHLSLKCFLE